MKFCTKDNFSILQIDPTFNIGSFSVTCTQYENLNLLSRRSGVHPVMVGPIMIHQQKTLEAYKTFPRFLIDQEKELENLRFYGTDGEENLSDAFQSVFKKSKHIRCFIHFEKNIDRKLVKIGVDSCNSKILKADLLGQQIGATFHEGIVDSDSEEEFEARFLNLKINWENLLGMY